MYCSLNVDNRQKAGLHSRFTQFLFLFIFVLCMIIQEKCLIAKLKKITALFSFLEKPYHG